VKFKGAELEDLGQEPRTKANIYGVKGSLIKVDVEGTGTLNQGADASAGGDAGGEGGSGQPALTMNLPKLYGLQLGSADLVTSALAVKWILISVLGMLAAGFVILYRKGNPLQVEAPPKNKNARGRS
jgi:hypothetical protein